MAYKIKRYLYNDKLTKEQNIPGMAEAFEKQLLEPKSLNVS